MFTITHTHPPHPPTHQHTLQGPLNPCQPRSPRCLRQSVSSGTPAWQSWVWLAPGWPPHCPAINHNPLALETVGRGSLPNPPLLLLSTLQSVHATISPPLYPPPTHRNNHNSYIPSAILLCRSNTLAAWSSPLCLYMIYIPLCVCSFTLIMLR